MGLNSVIEQAVDQAFSAASDLVGSGVIVRAASGAYDPVLDRVSGGSREITGLRMLKTSASQKDIEATQAALADSKILVPKKDLKGFIPSVSDIVRLNGIEYNILKVRDVPGTSLFSLMCLHR